MNADLFTASLPAECRVPDLGVMPFDFEKLQALADGPSLVKGADHIERGDSDRAPQGARHWELGRVMLKMVGDAYLEKSAR